MYILIKKIKIYIKKPMMQILNKEANGVYKYMKIIVSIMELTMVKLENK